MTQSFPALVNRPSFIEHKQYRFLVMDAPTDSNLPVYIDILKKKHVIALVRACEPTYKISPVINAGIRVLDLPFDDGEPPPEHMLVQWLQLVSDTFGGFDQNSNSHNNNVANSKTGTHPVTKSASGSISGTSTTSTAVITTSSSHNDLSAQTTSTATQSNGNSHTSNNHANESTTSKKCIGVHCVAGLGRAPVLVAIALIEAGMQSFEAIEFIRKKRRGAINAKQLKYLENYKPRRRKTKGDSGCCVQ